MKYEAWSACFNKGDFQGWNISESISNALNITK